VRNLLIAFEKSMVAHFAFNQISEFYIVQKM